MSIAIYIHGSKKHNKTHHNKVSHNKIEHGILWLGSRGQEGGLAHMMGLTQAIGVIR